ncbi:MAG TPA: winged helix-turn-helix domain-containing protein [Xanthobacteraceae bacterium]|nr:winged helix-turn-helix domain-containing protein [Xanthobacteraceae bacterium]
MQFLFQNHKLDTERRELSRGPDPIALEPQVFDLLVFLVENRDRVLSKDDLIDKIWQGRAVSDSTLTSRINAARKAIGDNGTDQRLIRTMPRKGFRFVADVTTGSAAPSRSQLQEGPPPLIVDRPSIAVLPIENLSEDRALELTANGLAEDIIALLARVPGFFVIARASSLAYRNGQMEVRQVAAELGVRYVVTGSMRSSESRVRVAVQLIEAETGNQLWAGRYDVERGDTLELQDEITRRIIVELEPALTKADLQIVRRRRTENPDAWSFFRRGAGAISVHGWNEDSVAEGLEQLRQAIAIDRNFALAWALLALMNAFGANLSLVPYPAKSSRDAKSEAERAVSIDPNASDVLGFAGCALADIGEVSRGYELLQRAVELDPSNAQARVAYGVTLARLGKYEEALESMRFGMRSSPRDFRLTFWSMLLADVLVRAGQPEEAYAVADGASRRDGRLYSSRVVAAWAAKKLNRTNDARHAIAEARRIRPTLSLDEIKRFFGENAAAELSSVWG